MNDVVVHVGPSRNARGGIARVIALLSGSDLASRFRLRFVATISPGAGVWSLLWFPGAVAHLIVLMIFKRPALVHLHTASRGSLLRKSFMAGIVRFLGGRYAVHLHGGGFADYYTHASPRGQAKILRFFRGASAVFVVSEAMGRFVSDTLGIEDPALVPNPIVFPKMVTEGLDSGRVISMGHLGPMKGTDDLLRAFALVIERVDGASLVLLGDGFSAELAGLAAELRVDRHLTLHGWLDAEQVTDELCRCAVFALPSLAEGMPLSLLEAMACGLACVATPVGGVQEAIEDGCSGVIVPVSDTAALADAMTRVLTDAELRHRLSSAGRERARLHALDAVAEVIGKQYRLLGVLESRGSG